MSEPVNDLIKNAHQARRENRLDDALEASTTAVELCRQAGGNAGELITALKTLGQIERDLGNLETALKHYLEAGQLCRAQGQPLQLAHTIRHVGDIHLDCGHLQQAEACYVEALELYRNDKQTAPLDLANAIRSVAILTEKMNNPEQARSLWAEARQLYVTSDIAAGINECDSHLAKLD